MAEGYLSPNEVYDSTELRKRIALQMIANSKRSGYPKNFGEGLTAIGDALGDMGQIKQAEAMMAKLEDQRTNEQQRIDEAARGPKVSDASGAPLAARVANVAPEEPLPEEIAQTRPPPAPVLAQTPPPQISPMQQQAAMTPTEQPNAFFPSSPQTAMSAPPSQLALSPPPRPNDMVMRNPIPAMRDTAFAYDQMPPMRAGGPRSDVAGPMSDPQSSQMAMLMGRPQGPQASPYAPTASLGAPGGTMSDADPVAQTRSSIYAALMNQQGPAGAVPPPNPTQPAASAPPTSQPSPTPFDTASLGSPPEAAQNRPIIMPDVQPAPAGPVPAPGAQLAENTARPPLPVRPAPVVPPSTGGEPPRPMAPAPIPRTDAQKAYEDALARARDPAQRQFIEERIKPLEAARARQEAINTQNYQVQMQAYDAQKARFDAQNSPVGQAQAAEAQAKALAEQKKNELREKFGNQDPEQVYKELATSRAQAKSGADALTASHAAMKAFNQGAITGTGANQKLDVAKLFTAMGLVDKHDLIANTETFKSAMQPVVAAILHQTSGTSQLSEGELAFAKAAAAGNITLDPKSIRDLMTIIDKRSKEVLDEHQGKVDVLFGKDNPQASATWGVPTPKLSPRAVNVPEGTTASKKLPDGTLKRIIVNGGYWEDAP